MTKTREELKVRLEALIEVQKLVCIDIQETQRELDELDRIRDRRIQAELEEELTMALLECQRRLNKTNREVQKIQFMLVVAE